MIKLSFLHIGKTGGTSLKKIFKWGRKSAQRAGFSIAVRGHKYTLPDMIEDGDARAIFFVRDPVKRYVSAFNSRLRQGRPRYDFPWTPAEAAAFEFFRTPDTLASAFSSEDETLRADARLAMRSIRHVNAPLTRWLQSTEFLINRQARIFYIGDQACFDDDVTRLLVKLGVTGEVPRLSETEKHQSLAELDKYLSAESELNLRQWYAADYQVYEWCLLNRGRINDRP